MRFVISFCSHGRMDKDKGYEGAAADKKSFSRGQKTATDYRVQIFLTTGDHFGLTFSWINQITQLFHHNERVQLHKAPRLKDNVTIPVVINIPEQYVPRLIQPTSQNCFGTS